MSDDRIEPAPEVPPVPPAGQGRGEAEAEAPPLPPAAEGQGEGAPETPPLPPAAEGQGEGAPGTPPLPPAAKGQGEGAPGTLPLPPAGEGRGEGEPPAGPAPRRTSPLRSLLSNLSAALALALLRRRRADAFRGGAGQLVALFLVNLVAGFAYDIYAIYPAAGRFDPGALPAASFWSLPLLGVAWLLSRLSRLARSASPAPAAAPDSRDAGQARDPVVLPLAVSGFALAACGSIASTMLAVAADYSPAIDQRYSWLVWVPVLWVAVAWAFAAPRIAGLARRRAFVAAALAAAAVMAPQWSADPAARLWVADDGGATPDDKSGAGPGAERFLYGQMDLLEDALDQIAPGRPGVAELYSIEFAGSSAEDVFLNEAQGVGDVMADLFDTGERNVLLANSRKRPGEAPFATMTSLQRALATVAERMDPDEDVLFLFLTSHGAPGSVLDVSLPPYQFEPVTPRRLRELLDESGIRYRVIVVSSCYSGGYAQALASDDTLVITASRADRTSFGCRDGQDWTDFGRAFFKEALPATGSFEGAFRRARELIAQREAAQKLTPSEPQIDVGESIRARLQELQTQKLGPRLMVQRDRRIALTPVPGVLALQGSPAAALLRSRFAKPRLHAGGKGKFAVPLSRYAGEGTGVRVQG